MSPFDTSSICIQQIDGIYYHETFVFDLDNINKIVELNEMISFYIKSYYLDQFRFVYFYDNKNIDKT